ncbi:MAG: hypothetical protein HQL39_17995, partial [Alphaproteobacteria bacterium]|nr:hypothetical protein [Alphaproteobacteria bacterium]
MAADGSAGVVYTFRFTYGNGDFYEGFGYADAATGFATGTQFDAVDQNGLTGTYQITSIEAQGGDDQAPDGTVVITNYFDAETGSSLSASGSGVGGLGSEAGHVFDQNGALVSSFNSGQA